MITFSTDFAPQRLVAVCMHQFDEDIDIEGYRTEGTCIAMCSFVWKEGAGKRVDQNCTNSYKLCAYSMNIH